MAYSTLLNSAPFFGSVRHAMVCAVLAVGASVARVNKMLIVNSTANARLEQVARLQTKTDAELAAMGLKREDIFRKVFRDFL